jgi:hypothetical protein
MGVTARIVETYGCDFPSGLFGLKDLPNISRSVHEHLKQGSEGVWRLGPHRVRLGRAVFALLWAESQFGGLNFCKGAFGG